VKQNEIIYDEEENLVTNTNRVVKKRRGDVVEDQEYN